MRQIAWSVAAVVCAAILAWLWGDSRGYDRGRLEVRAEWDRDARTRAETSLTAVVRGLHDSTQASKEMRTALAGLEGQNSKSTLELKNALKSNRGNSPVLCRFDADSMRILAEARDRAAALAARGIRGTLSATSGPSR
ncbi:hypothetical protein [Achromobacter insolitus]|uniref:hypothetical protein n=1 Tax=Achromobacter insolitus TaxID=217204 RepID=UPI0028AE6D78|nr:hypothetical protein [Achromobacter insolitus]